MAVRARNVLDVLAAPSQKELAQDLMVDRAEHPITDTEQQNVELLKLQMYRQ